MSEIIENSKFICIKDYKTFKVGDIIKIYMEQTTTSSNTKVLYINKVDNHCYETIKFNVFGMFFKTEQENREYKLNKLI